MCSGCCNRGLFFHSGKEFSNVVCTLLVIGREWVLEQVAAQGKTETVTFPVKGVEGSRSLFPICLSVDAQEQVLWGHQEVVWVFFLFFEVVLQRILLVVSRSSVAGCILYNGCK